MDWRINGDSEGFEHRIKRGSASCHFDPNDGRKSQPRCSAVSRASLCDSLGRKSIPSNILLVSRP